MNAAWLKAARAAIDEVRREARGRLLWAFSPDGDVLDALDAFAAGVEGAPADVVAKRTLAMVRLLEHARPELGQRELENLVTCTLRVHARLKQEGRRR